MKPETIKRLIDEGRTSDEILELLQQDGRLRKEKKEIERQEEVSRQRHADEKARLGILQIQLRSACPHLETTFYPDASGNSDSFRACDLCGKEW